MIPVAANDVAFSTHAVLLTAITLFQIAIYEVRMIFLLIKFFVCVSMTAFFKFAELDKKLFHCSVEVRKCPKFLLELFLLFGWLLQFVSLLLCLTIPGFGSSTSSSMLSLLLSSIISQSLLLPCPVEDCILFYFILYWLIVLLRSKAYIFCFFNYLRGKDLPYSLYSWWSENTWLPISYCLSGWMWFSLVLTSCLNWSCCSSIQVFMTTIKYIPQVRISL